MTVGQAAIEAGTAISEPIAEGVSQIIDKTTNAVLEIVYKGVSYASELLTSAVASTLAKDAYFMVLSNSSTGEMFYCVTAIDRNFALSIMSYNNRISVYTYYEYNARSIAQEASHDKSPIHHDAHKSGYYSHYHVTPYTLDGAHAFYGLPQF